jgi:hypothetical protein
MAEDDDDEVAEALNEASLTAISDAQERFLESVQSGDGDRLRAAFQGPDSYLLGLNNAHGRLETILLEEALRTPMDLQLLWVFFKELGVGRFMVDLSGNVCVFSVVIGLDEQIARETVYNLEDAARHSERVAEVVRYLVETLSMPVPRRRPFHVRPIDEAAPLLVLARREDAWASYAALARYVKDADEMHMLPQFIRHRATSPYDTYWLKRLLPEAPDAQLERLLLAQPAEPLFEAERDRRVQKRQHMRALFMLPSDAAPGRAVQQDPYLSQLIAQGAWGQSLF